MIPGLKRRSMVLLVTALVAMGGTLVQEYVRAVTPPPTPFQLAADAMGDPQVGVGADVLLPRAVAIEHPMAIALYASANALYPDDGTARTRLAVAADRLIQLADSRDDGYGWGLNFAYDELADGTTNPADTVYGITTALAVRALIDAHQVLHRGEYLDAARRALDAYKAQFVTRPSGGYFLSSDHRTDPSAVLNVSAMLAGQYARASVLTGNAAYASLAEDAAEFIMNAARRDEDGDLYWPFRFGESDANDAVHAGYLVEGLLEVRDAIGLPGFDADAAIGRLRSFITDQALVTRFANGTDPDRSWGVGQLMYVFCTYHPDAPTIRNLQSALATYEYAPGRYGPHPGVDVFYPRFQGHVLLGIAACDDER